MKADRCKRTLISIGGRVTNRRSMTESCRTASDAQGVIARVKVIGLCLEKNGKALIKENTESL